MKKITVKSKGNAKSKPVYLNPKLTAERRVKDLLSRMTLREKAAQMLCVWQKKSSTLVDENYKPAARRGYLFDDISPLYAFGFGLSYTMFKFGEPRLRKKAIRRDESTAVLVDVTNTGTVAGDEVVQMYIRDKVSSVTRPVKELKGFQRIGLEPGQTMTVSLEITPEQLAFFNIDMNYVVEPGEFEIMVGNSSRDQDLQTILLRVK